MPRPRTVFHHDPFNQACDQLRKLAKKTYADDSGKLSGCKQAISELEQTVNKGNYVEGVYDPYQVLADLLAERYGEVWNGGGEALLHPFLASQ